MKLLQSTWMICLLASLVYLGTTAAVLSSVKLEVEIPVEEPTELEKLAPGNDPSWKFRNPEFEQWVQDLRNEKAALETRKVQLGEWEARLLAQRQELCSVTQKVAQLQADFEKNVVRLKEQEGKNLKRQAKAVAEMAPDTAAKMLDQMTDDDIVRLFSAMKNEQVTLLLETLSKQGKGQTRRAAAITERMRHLLPDSATAAPNTL
jgi:flagellar motility protein MotE (MotC chaperone)